MAGGHAVQQSLATGIVLTQFLGYNNDWFGNRLHVAGPIRQHAA